MKELFEEHKDKLSENFINLFEDFKGNFLEFESIKNTFLENTILDKERIKTEVHWFLKDSVDSLYGFWKVSGKLNPESPIVFLHCDGEPCTVIARNFDEFLPMLSIGSYAVSKLEDYLLTEEIKRKGRKVRPINEFEKREIELIQQELTETFEDYEEFLNFLQNQKVNTNVNFLNRMLEAREKFPNFSDFVKL